MSEKEKPDNIAEMNPWPHLAGPLFVDYAVAKECNNPDTYGVICVKCGACGRKFENGLMIDDGGTHPDMGEES